MRHSHGTVFMRLFIYLLTSTEEILLVLVKEIELLKCFSVKTYTLLRSRENSCVFGGRCLLENHDLLYRTSNGVL